MRQTVLVLLAFTSWTAAAPAQEGKLLQEVVEQVARAEGRGVARQMAAREAMNLERTIALQESEEAARILAQRLPSAVDEAGLLGRFGRLPGTNQALEAEFRLLPLAERRAVVELGESAQQIFRLYPPDEALALVQHLDAAGLAQARTYGDFVVDGAHWLQSGEVLESLADRKLSAEEAAAVAKTLGLRSLPETIPAEKTTQLWKAAVRKSGEGVGRFWREYIVPHKGKWLAAGLLASYLAMPEKFHDALGNLTEYGTRKLTELGASVALGAGRGVVNGPIDAIKKHYAADPGGTVASLMLIALLLVLAVPPARWLLWHKVIGRFWRHGQPRKPAPAPFHTPFRE
jgi:hypothetical protein